MRCTDWIERWALLEPDREAMLVAETGERVSYGELHRRVLAAQGWLRNERGVRAGDRIAILAKNRPDHVDLFFALARLGAVLVPVNWRLAPREVGFVLSDSAPRAVMFEPELEGLLEDWDGCAQPLAETGSPWRDYAGDPGEVAEVDPDDPAMIVYTSGTTGTPKGALLTQRGIYQNSVNTTLGWDLSGADSTLTHTPFFHCGGWHVLTTPLLHRGGRFVLTRGFDAEAALRLVGEEKLSLLFAVPTMFEMMMAAPGWAEASLDSLRFAISGGAACPAHVSAAFLERGVRFKQGYGLTEAGPNCFAVSLEVAAEKPSSVGVPIHGVEVRLVDEAGEVVPEGEVGELLLRGDHVCAGYWGRPEATDELFLDGWLRTGDLFQRDGDGHYFVVGRRKEMFISGGENVYPAEVEKALLEHPSVEAAAVVPLEDERWGEVGRAFLVCAGDPPEVDALKAHCGDRLARYKVPKRWEFLDAMPLTATGKIAKAELAKRPV